MYLPENSRTDPRVNSLRLLFRGIHAFRSFYEAEGQFEIIGPDCKVLSLFDIEYLYKVAMRRPAVVNPVFLAAKDLPVGHFIRHSGGWHRIITHAVTTTDAVVMDLSNAKTKKCAGSVEIETLSPQQKQLIDYDRAHPCLPLRQQQAIELFLVLNLPEDEAAIRMGLSETNPIGMYATSGLTRLLKMMDAGQLSRFFDDSNMLMVG